MARKPMSYQDYQNCLWAKSVLPAAILVGIFGIVFSLLLISDPLSSGLIIFITVLAIFYYQWLVREIEQYEKEHFHSKDKENDSSDSSDSDTSPKS